MALAIAIVVVLAFVSQQPDLPPTPEQARIAHTPESDDDRPSALVLGDSYTAGNGLAEMSYACVAAIRLGWLCDLSAIAGTGYISGGPANRFVVDPYVGESTSFAERIPHLAAAYAPDTVVLDGGRNDRFPPREDVFNAMRSTIEDVRRTWPTARVVFIRPRLLNDPRDEIQFDDDFMARLQSDPAADGVIFVDPIASLADTDTSEMMAADGTHPNQHGDHAIAEALFESLAVRGMAGEL
ncbi:SGNH/GDSL hydrolase family protein [Rhodococcus sp. NPDC003383]